MMTKKPFTDTELDILEYLKKISVDGATQVTNMKIAEEVICGLGTATDSLKSLELKGKIKRDSIGRKRIIRLVEA